MQTLDSTYKQYRRGGFKSEAGTLYSVDCTGASRYHMYLLDEIPDVLAMSPGSSFYPVLQDTLQQRGFLPCSPDSPGLLGLRPRPLLLPKPSPGNRPGRQWPHIHSLPSWQKQVNFQKVTPNICILALMIHCLLVAQGDIKIFNSELLFLFTLFSGHSLTAGEGKQ